VQEPSSGGVAVALFCRPRLSSAPLPFRPSAPPPLPSDADSRFLQKSSIAFRLSAYRGGVAMAPGSNSSFPTQVSKA
jgi:hypothetical protein